MGALDPGSVHARPSAQAPIDTSRNFLRMCLVGGVKSIFLPFQAILSTFLFFRKKPKKSTPAGAWGGAPIFFYPKYFVT